MTISGGVGEKSQSKLAGGGGVEEAPVSMGWAVVDRGGEKANICSGQKTFAF